MGDDGIWNCGLLMTETESKTANSAIEDMCSIGKDHKSAQTTNTQLNLERHCMAAALNLAATTLMEGGTCDSEYPGIQSAFNECCGTPAPLEDDDLLSVCNGGDGGGTRDISGCIGVIGMFNELSDGNDLDEMDLCPDNEFTGFESPCSADSSLCRDAKGNNWLNEPRDREVKCNGKNCP